MSVIRYLRDAAVFAPCYIALDWASYFDPVGPFNITPWNPQAALAVCWMLLRGLRHAPAVFVTIVAADFVVRATPGGYALTTLTALVLTAGYGGLAYALRRLLHGDVGLHTARSLTVFVAAVLAVTAFAGAAFIGVLHAAGRLSDSSTTNAWLRFWIGDAVGILVTAPLLLAAADPARRAGMLALARRREALGQLFVLLATIWLIFEVLPGAPEIHFYLLFLPLIWIAARGGMNGAIVATAIVQLGVVFGVHRGAAGALPVIELQALVAALTLTGLYLGMMVDEREQAESRLRRSLRLAAAGEMAGAIAHEVNQPLTALANYARSALALAARGAAEAGRLEPVLGKMLAEAERAAAVVRRLRDFFRTGSTVLEAMSVEEVLAAARRIGGQIIDARPVALEVRGEPGVQPLYVDRLQVEVVLRNLIANAADAVHGRQDARIDVRVAPDESNQMRIVVADNGPGLPESRREDVFEPFVSGKPTGMGLGLAVSRAIAEAHGGSLEARAGGEFHLVLPCLPPR
jgi:two-component system, LuxR family, sensor kinase FixL